MIVIIEEDVFEQYHSKPFEIIRLFHFGMEGRHDLLSHPLFDKENSSSPLNLWLNRLDDSLRECCELVLNVGIEAQVKESPLDITIRTVADAASDLDVTPPRLTLEDTCTVLGQPLRIILENSRNDLAFLKCIAPPDWKEKLSDCLKKKWIEPFHAGGIGEMEKQLEEHFIRKPFDILRSWVLFDSDARKPDSPSESSRKLEATCQESGFAYHQLKRRFIENYLPVQAIFAWANLSKRSKKQDNSLKAKTFANLSSEQKHHYNMKQGIAQDEKSGGAPLFQDLDEKNRRALSDGFGKQIAELFKQAHFSILQEWLLRDGQHDEIQAIIQGLFKRM